MSEEFKDTEPSLSADLQFQQQWDMADAKLGVAEQLAWPLAMGWGLAVGLMTHHWLPGLLVFGCAYYFVRRPYAKESGRFDKIHREKTFGPDPK
ncbi:hypothetical protein [Acidovorax sp. SD340]|uniref:hypothetical protein n=1 Tax=Acidovorax sp. SD340 TaxID=1690268 RepID=UPI0006DC4BF1|nr:hypothetical protein [Acidovorax sp. SD340]KQB59364.1 hypothetical protein AE621_10620 [Acidovorax sp. SD340]MBO1007092.1 hypothetical protein [Acidovorax sp. SD340]